ncbi:MAG: ATP-binding protein [Microthrixaceae bacterium]
MTNAAPAAGNITFLFSDIEGSTALLVRRADDYPELVLTHRRLLRDVWRQHGGHEVGTEGDSFLVSFADTVAAVGAAASGQRALLAHPWPVDASIRVRMGLHTGPIRVIDGDYFGITVHQAARIAATAHGGQVVVSDVTMADASGAHDFMDLGLHRLKDLARPIRLYQLLGEGMPTEFPPPRSLTVWPNNFPIQTTPFIGRADDLAGVHAALTDHTVVTLTGAGGVGKTRLALQVAAESVSTFPDGAWLVDLAPVGDPDLVASTAAAALGIPEQAGRDPIDTLVDALVAWRTLIVLDNCEHLIGACAELVDRVVSSCPGVKVLATSRESLSIPAEWSWRLRSLHVPDEADARLHDVSASEGVRLFVDRATAVRHDFALTTDTAPAIAKICRRLDGLPLAIELAAARVRSMSVHDIADRLDDRFRLLTGGSRLALPRQRTLEAAVAWSYDLLEPDTQLLFDRLSVFAGGATLPAVETVCAGDDHAAVVDALDRLVDRSLVVTEESADGAARYRQLETLRQFARDRLLDRGATAAMRDRHLQWALDLAASLPQMSGQTLPPDVRADEDNFRAATEWALETGDEVAALSLVGALWVGHFDERARLYERVLPPGPSIPPAVAGRALFAGGGLAFMMGHWDLGVSRMELAARSNAECGNRSLVSLATTYQAACEWGRGDRTRARGLIDLALTEADAAGDPAARARVRMLLAWLEAETDLTRAEEVALEAMTIGRQLADVFELAHGAEALAFIRSERLGWAAASNDLADAISLFRDVQHNCRSHILETVAAWAAMQGRFELGAELWGSALRVRDETHDSPRPWEQRVQDVWLPAIRDALTPEVLAAAHQRGRAREATAALDFAESVVRTLTDSEA